MSLSPKTGQVLKVDYEPAISQKKVGYAIEYEKDVRRSFQGQSGF